MFEAYIDFIKSLILRIPLTLFDYIIIGAFGLYVFEDISFGAIPSAISLASTISSFFIGIAVYPWVSGLLVEQLSLAKGISDAIAFLAVSFVGFIVVSFLLSIFRKKYIKIELPKNADVIGGLIFGTLSFFFIASFAVSLLLSFPTSALIKDSIRNSVSGKFLSVGTQGIDRAVRIVFGGAIEDTINFLTVKPNSDQSISLNFKTTSYKVDIESEKRMLDSVNQERGKIGLSALEFDEKLTQVARNHAKDMLERGYFSHYTPEGLSPFDRMAVADVSYQYAGENLAFAPDVAIAMNGLMKSPGHRENILSANFGKLGAGVIDAGIYGKMFVQEFTD